MNATTSWSKRVPTGSPSASRDVRNPIPGAEPRRDKGPATTLSGRYSSRGFARAGGTSVRVRTSRTILLWLAVIFLGGMLLLALAEDAEAKRELPAQVAAWGFIGLLLFLGWWFKVRPRRELHQEQARSIGLRSAPGDPLRFFERPFALLGHAADRKSVV